MFSVNAYTGAEMPAKSLCLTYDDGPGPLTLDIARFLHGHGIQATFFVVGKYAIHNKEVLATLRSLGHLIGNHTYDHPDLPYYCSVDGNVQDQIIRTDHLIAEHIEKGVTYFRAPYGKWSPETANELNANIQSALNHIGPIFWDIPGIDCYYWKQDKSVSETVERYLAEIETQGKGIIVMHDDLADNDTIKPKNKTFELTKELIPVLLKKGYTFVRLDEIESIRKQAAQPDLFAIKNSKGKFWESIDGGGYPLSVTGRAPGNKTTLWEMAFCGSGKVALKASNGCYLTANPSETEDLSLKKTSIGPLEVFDLIPIRDNAFVLRTNNGNYLTSLSDKNSKVKANAEHMRQAEIFFFHPLNVEPRKKITFKKKMELLKKRLLFVRSKIMHG